MNLLSISGVLTRITEVSDNGFGKMSGTFIIMENVYKKCARVILMKRKLVV